MALNMKKNIFALLLISLFLAFFLLNFLFVETTIEAGKKHSTMNTQARTTEMLLWQVYGVSPGIALYAKSNYQDEQYVGFFRTTQTINSYYIHITRIALETLWSEIEISEMKHAVPCFRMTNFNERKSDKIRNIEFKDRIRQQMQIGHKSPIYLRFKCSKPKEYLNNPSYRESPAFYYHDYIYKTIRNLKQSEDVLQSVCPDAKYYIKKCNFDRLFVEVELMTNNLTRLQKQVILSKLLFIWPRVKMINKKDQNTITIRMQCRSRHYGGLSFVADVE